MPDIRVIISAMNKASKDIDQVKKDIQGVKSESKDATPAVGGFGDKLKSMMGTAAAAAGALAAVGLAVKEVYDGIKEGAELEYARVRFDNLAKSIGTTSDALLGDMKTATAGMVSDAELVASASDFMSLGLADTSEEVVRLATVAGALGMNMNQLVLALTNQTTARFDQLNISVVGFDDKVKALTASGMSAQEAFSEAFLQQAEEQIEKVGSKAGTSAGQIQTMEAAFKNLGDAIKLTTASALDGLAPVLTTLANNMTTNEQVGQEYTDVMGQLKGLMDDGTISGSQYRDILRDLGVHSGMGAATTEQLAKATRYLAIATGEGLDSTQSWADANYESAEGMAAAQAAAGGLTQEVEVLTEAQLKMIAAHEGITTLDSTYKGIINLGYKYSDTLAEINAKQAEYDAMPGWKKASEDGKQLLSDIDALKGSMKDLANQVTLDMFQATIAIGGVTESELAAYMQMAIDMGLMSEEGAQAALDAYGNAIKTINGYELDEKTGNITFDAQQAFDVITMINAMEIADKNGNINMFLHYYGTSGGPDPYEDHHAAGGPVSAGKPYLWQEYGYRGEKFVPAQNGYILSRSDAARAVANAASQPTVDSGPSAREIANAVKQGVKEAMRDTGGGKTFNLTMPTSSNPADVRTAFELMEAWA